MSLLPAGHRGKPDPKGDLKALQANLDDVSHVHLALHFYGMTREKMSASARPLKGFWGGNGVNERPSDIKTTTLGLVPYSYCHFLLYELVETMSRVKGFSSTP